MGEKILLTVEERKVLGKKVSQLRKQGLVPGVVYGHGVEATAVMAPATVLNKVWREVGGRQPVHLTIGDGQKRLAMIKSADFEPVKRSLRHMSFHVVKQNEKVETEVPIHIVGEGETEAEQHGLVVLQALENARISAFPGDLPEALSAPSEKLVLEGDVITVADITPIDGVEILNEPEVVVASVYEPSALAAKMDEQAGDATDESEVVAENGAAEEGEAAEGDAKAKNGNGEKADEEKK
jgi:large subunit ribosomal protein L25